MVPLASLLAARDYLRDQLVTGLPGAPLGGPWRMTPAPGNAVRPSPVRPSPGATEGPLIG